VTVPRSALTALGTLVLLAGCGLTNQAHSVAWTATLDRVPEPACIQDRLASLPDIFRTELTRRPGGSVVNVCLKPVGESAEQVRENKTRIEAEMKRIGVKDYRDFADIHIVLAPGPRGNFVMGYMGWPQAGDPREVAARESVQRLSDSCIPGLSGRVKENHDAEWLPYLFNI
jgi:hypothetical protein